MSECAPSRDTALDHGSDFANGCSPTLFELAVGYVGQVGAFLGVLTTFGESHQVLRPNRKLVREPRPPMVLSSLPSVF
jgi:hypothetical protein